MRPNRKDHVHTPLGVRSKLLFAQNKQEIHLFMYTNKRFTYLCTQTSDSLNTLPGRKGFPSRECFYKMRNL